MRIKAPAQRRMFLLTRSEPRQRIAMYRSDTIANMRQGLVHNIRYEHGKVYECPPPWAPPLGGVRRNSPASQSQHVPRNSVATPAW